MISVKVFFRADNIVSVSTEGHSGYADAGADIVCAAVTSAVRFVDAVLNDTLGLGTPVSVDEEIALIKIDAPADISAAQPVFTAFWRLMCEYSTEYPANIQVITMEVQ